MRVLVVRYLVSLREATKIIKLFKKRKHKNAGYSFELQELEYTLMEATALIDAPKPYASDRTMAQGTWLRQDAFLLHVYRDHK